MKMKKMTSEKKHKIATIGLWLILILCTAVLFSLCLSEGLLFACNFAKAALAAKGKA